MSMAGIWRTLGSAAGTHQFSHLKYINVTCGGICNPSDSSAAVSLWASSATCGTVPALSRWFAADASSQEGSQSLPGSERASAPPSLKDLLQASSQRLAQGDLSHLLDEETPAGAAPDRTAAPHSPGLTVADRAEPSIEEQLTSLYQQGADRPSGPADFSAEDVVSGGSQQQRLLHPKYGYAALGGLVPSDTSAGGVAGLVDMLTAQSPRVNPRRRFMPGDTYEPQDLNPFAAPAAAEPQRRPVAVPRPSVQEVMQKADYKNVAFLSRWFLSPAGRLLPRRVTRLPIQVHRHVSRQVKLARHMGLMAGEARLDKMHLPRVREQELAEAQRRAAAGGAAGGRYNELLDFGA